MFFEDRNKFTLIPTVLRILLSSGYTKTENGFFKNLSQVTRTVFYLKELKY